MLPPCDLVQLTLAFVVSDPANFLSPFNSKKHSTYLAEKAFEPEAFSPPTKVRVGFD
jgi:hypothetical protein